MIAGPAAVIAGMVATAAMVTGLDPFLRRSLALIAGGGIAGTVQMLTGLTRVTSTATTGGLGNPLVATLEAAGSITLSFVAIAIPLAAAAIVIALLLFCRQGRRMLWRLRARKGI